MRCVTGKCAFDQSPNCDSNTNTIPNPNPNPNLNPNRNAILTSTKCDAYMQVG